MAAGTGVLAVEGGVLMLFGKKPVEQPSAPTPVVALTGQQYLLGMFVLAAAVIAACTTAWTGLSAFPA